MPVGPPLVNLLAAIFFCVLYLLFGVTKANSQTNLHFEIPRVLNRPKIDGNAETSEWELALRIPVQVEVNPRDNVDANVTAEAMLMEDGEIIYIAFLAGDPDPSQIRGFYQDRDTVDADYSDYMGIILDTFNDERRAFGFSCSARSSSVFNSSSRPRRSSVPRNRTRECQSRGFLSMATFRSVYA